MQPRALAAPLPLLGISVAVLGAIAVLFSGGSSDGPLFWIGGLTLACAGVAVVAAAVGELSVPTLTPFGLTTVGFFAALVVWEGFSLLWSIEPDRTWEYFNRSLVYLAFLLLGIGAGQLRRAPRYGAAWLAVVTAVAVCWALATKIFPQLSAETERVARLSSPVGYWNVLALLTAFAVPLALWIAAPRTRPDWLRASAVTYLYASLVALVLTFSRGGIGVAIAAAALWILVGRPRLESAAALAVAVAPMLVVIGWAFSRPGLTQDSQPRSLQVHDGRWFGLALLVGAAAAFTAAFFASRYERERRLAEAWRQRLGRGLVAVAVIALLAGLGGLLAAGITPSRVLHKINEPTPLSKGTGPQHFGTLASSSRWNWWKEAWDSWTDNPVLGTGAGSFELTHRRLRIDGTYGTEPHSLPLQFLSETGIVGFLLFLGIAVAGVAAVIETLRRLEGEDRLAGGALVVALGAYVIHGAVDFDWDFIAVTGPAAAVLGLMLAARRPVWRWAPAKRPVAVVAAGACAAAALYSLFAPWLATRRVDAAYAALGRGEPASAVADAKSAHDLNPVSIDALFAWAAAERRRGHTRAAGRLYTRAIATQPDNWRPWYYRAQFLQGTAGPQAALFDARQAAKRDPLGLAGDYAKSLESTSQ